MFTKYYKALLPKALFAGSVLAALAPGGLATADDRAGGGDSSPYLIGHWKLNENFSDVTAGSGSPISTENNEFVFLNPTNVTLTLEYAFFATNDTTKKVVFCGCDRDTLQPNGRVRYKMLGEKQGGQFSTDTNHCPTQTVGTMKTIVFTSKISDPVKIDDALETGYQVDVFRAGAASGGGFRVFPITGRTEAGLLAVAINDKTKAEIQEIHNKCNKFIKK